MIGYATLRKDVFELKKKLFLPETRDFMLRGNTNNYKSKMVKALLFPQVSGYLYCETSSENIVPM